MGSSSMISPTGKGIRNDTTGMGSYGASRGARLHSGTDYLCDPGQDVLSPINGIVERVAYPYADKSYGGLVIQGDQLCVKMFYFEPNSVIVGKHVKKGDIVGTAQDISKRYNERMRPHIHVGIVSFNPNLLISI